MNRMLIALALLTGCAVDHHAVPYPTPLTCGVAMCGEHQYCADVCTCCGNAPDGGVVTPSSFTECRAMPAACEGLTDDALRTCLNRETGGDAFSPEPRLVSFPCA